MSEKKRKVIKLYQGEEEKRKNFIKLLLKYIEMRNRDVGK